MNHSSRNPLTPIPISSTLSSVDNNDCHGRLTSPINHTPLTTSPLQTSPPTSKTLNIQRPRMPPTFGSHSLRDYPLNNYDRQLTVEKATFDPVPYIPSQPQQTTSSLNVPSNMSTSTTSSTINNQESPITFYRRSPPSATLQSPSSPLHLLQLQDEIPLPSSSSSSSSKVPEKSLPAATKRKDASFAHSPPRFMKPPPLPKPERRRSTKKKKRKLPPVNGTATPSEVFHRNLVDAVSNVEDSDENEQYVYPYSHYDPTTSSITSSKRQYPSMKRPLLPATSFRRSSSTRPLINSAPGSFLSLQQKRQGGVLNGLVNGTHRSMSSLYKWVTNSTDATDKPQRDEEEGRRLKYPPHHRPKLRNYINDHPRSSNNSTFYPHAWAHEFSSSDEDDDDDDEDDDDDDDDDNDGDDDDDVEEYEADAYGGDYDSKDEYTKDGLPHHDSTYGAFRYRNLQYPRRRRRRRPSGLAWILRNTCLSLLVFILAMMILTVYRAEPLMDLTASMGHSLASDKELIFDLKVEANNWNWWTVRVQDADLSVFAFSDLLNTTFGPAEYLGTCQQFDQPLSFTSAVLLPHHERATAATQIKIKSPGGEDRNPRWSRLIRSPFGLVTRGVIQYRPFPLFGLSTRHSIPLCVVTHVDPASFVDGSDHGYCSHYIASYT